MAAIGILGMGTMGAAVGTALKTSGHRVLTDLRGRSDLSVQRAIGRGIEITGSLNQLMTEVDFLFSIVPPDQALPLAETLAAESAGISERPVFVDANAVAPQTVQRIARACENADLPFLDGGIVGGPPTADSRPRLYLSGGHAGTVAFLDGQAFDHVVLQGQAGQASMFKMLYAGLTKGLNALLVNQLTAAERAGLFEAYVEELAMSQQSLLARAESVIPRMPADAERWTPEMREIASALGELDLPTGFHKAAERVMQRLASSPFATETRETVDAGRTVRDTLREP
ncbi:MAG: NAD(P)-dependent oxidoreductase [Boseongicola sp. SB0677_bin_26]|nr:NAD(P)-dependent oxidoreductase [Boseongicola sp. SB0665_bin_10]MYG25704.1 NAD(P)-dependent oxidoreductase [Boseongicola sp. SB0677_bin_26]